MMAGPEPRDTSHEEFMRLFLENEHEVLRYVLALVPNLTDARDIVQETAVSLWKRFADYDPEQPFAPWACRFALNKVRHHWRREKRKQQFFADETMEYLAVRRVELADVLDYRRDFLKECLRRMPEHSKAIVVGYYFREKTVEQLSEETGRTVEAIYKALQRIRRGLCDCITQRMLHEARVAP
jgi:RNA polymerase sigma-70 factor (ECF subfamily)